MRTVNSIKRQLIRIQFVVVICVFIFIWLFKPSNLAAIEPLQPLYEKALSASNNGNFIEAQKLWDQLLDIYPDNPAALSNRGNIRLVLGDPKGAISDQDRAIELAPLEPDPHFNRGTAEESLQQWDAAALDYSWILERDPEDASALYNLGNVRAAQGDWIKAEALYNKAALARPAFVMARSSMALSAYELGELDQAEVELRRIIRRYPMLADARAALSALLWRKGSLGEAESNWAAAAGLDSRYRQKEWLLKIRRWPPQPTSDLMAFLALESP